MKRKFICMALCVSLASLTACTATDQFSEELSKAQQEQEELLDEAKEKQKDLMDSLTGQKDDVSEEPQTETEEPQKETESSTQDVEPETEPPEDAKKEIASGAHEIAGAKFFFSKSVNNDVTGKWRISTVNTSMSAEEYALEYYKELFASDDEIHGIVNFALNTTSRITVLDSKTLDVSILEYVDGEEHDAKELFGGTVLGKFFVDIETGDVKEATE